MTVQRAIEISQGGDKPPLNAKGPQMTTTSEAPPLLLLKGEDMLQNFQTYVNPQYDRSQRQWQTPNGATFPAGPQGRNAARLVAIAEASPEIADKITEIGSDPALFKRLLDAAELIIAGDVYQNHVASQTDPDRFYKVDYRMSYHCQCDSFFYKPVTLEGYGDMCKHSLAQHLAVILDIDLQPAPIPFQGEALNFDENDVF